MRKALVFAFVYALYGYLWIIALIILILALEILSIVQDAMDCLSFIDNADYVGTEEGEYY